MPNLRGFKRGEDGYFKLRDNIVFTGKTKFEDVNIFSQDNPLGDIWYVDGTNGSTSNNGKSWNEAFSTITLALAAAGNYDWIVIMPGEYEERAKLNITQTGLKLLGVNVSNQTDYGMVSIYVAVNYYGTDSFVGVDLEANHIEIAGINFAQWSGNYMIDLAPTGTNNVYGCYIHDCTFNLGSVSGAGGIIMGHTGIEAIGTVVERCKFHDIAGATSRGVVLDSGASTIKDCVFHVGTAGVAIEDAVTFSTTSRPRRRILNSQFTTTDNTNAYAIKVTQTPSAGCLLVHGNQFLNFADDDHICSKRTGYMGLNYQGVTGVTVTT